LSSTPEIQLRTRLISLIQELNILPNPELREDTSLLRSGLLDSLALVRLAEWIQAAVGPSVDLLQFDLSKEWDTILGIERFIQQFRAD